MKVKNFGIVATLSTLLQVALVADAEETYTVETPTGDFEATSTSVEAFPQEVSTLGEDFRLEVNRLAAAGPEFVRIFLPDVSEPSLEQYDEAFKLWQDSHASDPDAVSEALVIDIIGSYLGNKLVSELDMEWVEVTDQYGSDYAVHHPQIDVFAYPFSTVQKRVEKDEYDFIFNVYYMVKQAVENGTLERRADQSEQ